MTITLTELNRRWPGAWHIGKGPFVVVCPADRRVTFCESREVALEVFHGSCGGRKCEMAHLGFKLEQETPAPKPVSRWFKQMVEEA